MLRRQLQIHVGSITEHTVYNGEGIGAILSLHLLGRETVPRDSKITLYIDNQALVKALGKPNAKSGQWIIREIYDTVTAWLKQNQPARFTFCWISAHSDVDLNEAVDVAAKEAAGGISSYPGELPKSLRSSIPHDIAALRQRFNAELKALWKAKWTSSQRYARMTAIDPDFPLRNFLTKMDGKFRVYASILFQIRMNHIPLNAYLFRFKRADSDGCPHCGKRETVHHFINECKSYSRERHTLRVVTGRGGTSLKTLMSTEKYLAALIEYIVKTKRLRTH